MRKNYFIFLCIIFSTFYGFAYDTDPGEIINIQDSKFRLYLLNNSDINTNGDNYIQKSEAEAFDGYIYCAEKSISSLTGIEHFINLKGLDVSKNDLKSIDLLKNKSLEFVECSRNDIENIRVSHLPNLTRLYCNNNEIEKLVLRGNVALATLDCSVNKLKSVDLSDNMGLTNLYCRENDIENIDVSQHLQLRHIICNSNKLVYLNIQNGNNTNFNETLYFQNNPDLTCIKVDDKAFADANWSSFKDSTAEFNEDCIDIIDIPDAKFKSFLVNNTAINTDGDNHISFAEAESFTGKIDCSFKLIRDMKGIERFVNIEELHCDHNRIESLDVSKNTKLKILDCEENKIGSLNLRENTLLEELNCRENNLFGLDVSNNLLIKELTCGSNGIFNLDVTNQTALTTLSCGGNLISELDVTNNLELVDLACSANSLSNLDVSNNLKLRKLYCGYNEGLKNIDVSNNIALVNLTADKIGLTSIDVSKNQKLITLSLDENSLTTIDISGNPDLYNLSFFSNNLESVDLSNNLSLGVINCSSNLLTSLNVEANIALRNLNCSFNKITTLDVSKSPFLKDIDCSNNELTRLNVKNGNNSNFSDDINFGYNSDLTCVEVDDVFYSERNWGDDPLRSSLDAVYSEDCDALENGYIVIPDVNFKNYLLSQSAINLNGDDQIQTEEASMYEGVINCPDLAIESLEGIENFIKITSLDCSNNTIEELDLNYNTALKTLNCSQNNIKSLRLRDNIALENLDCSYNVLESLFLHRNASDGEKLMDINCSNNELSSINISNNTALKNLNCSGNELEDLNVTSNVLLENLTCFSNEIEELDVSSNGSLKTLNCNANEIVTLDLSNNNQLTSVSCDDNRLITLNLKNGNNSNFVARPSFLNNEKLFCVEVDSKAYADTNWSEAKYGEFLEFSENCGAAVEIPDTVFKAYLVNDIYININGDDEIQFSEARAYEGVIRCVNLGIKDLKGIEAFTTIKELYCDKNELVTLDVSQNTGLTFLSCTENQITALDLSKNTNIEDVFCSINNLSVLNIKNGNNLNLDRLFTHLNPNLTCIQVDNVVQAQNSSWRKDATASYSEDCGYATDAIVVIPDANFKTYLLNNTSINTNGDNEIQVLEATSFSGEIQVPDLEISSLEGIAYFTRITKLDCQENNLQTLDVSSNTELTSLDCSKNELTSINITGNLKLEELFADSNNLNIIDTSNNTSLLIFSCTSNEIDELNLANNTSLLGFSCEGNNITTLDVSNNLNLRILYCSKNELTDLDVSQNTALVELLSRSNKLETLNLKNGNNANFTNINVTGNLDLTCIQVDSKTYSDNNWSTLKDSTAEYREDCNISSDAVVIIPDFNFKSYLVNNTAINTNGDSEIQVTEAQSFSGTINCSNLSIDNLEGIEYFPAITGLNCNDNGLTNLNISNNINLVSLNFDNNNITTIDVSKNTLLNSLSCFNNRLTALDVSSNTALSFLVCADNFIEVLDFSSNDELTDVYCNGNELTRLDVSNLKLTNFDCSNNNLTTLIIDNGYSTTLDNFLLSNNPDLTCIQVDNKTYFDQNWSAAKDATANYSEDCSTLPDAIVYIPDANFKSRLVSNADINTNRDDEIQVSEAKAFSGAIDVSDANINSLEGISFFTEITSLNCSENNLTELSVEENIVLTYLNCSKNSINTLDVTKNKVLQELDCHLNELTYLAVFKVSSAGNVERDDVLTSLDCSSNELSSLDVSYNTSLTHLTCSYNTLESLNVSENSQLKYLNCFSNNLEQLFLFDNFFLEELYCGSNNLTSLNISSNQNLERLNVKENKLTTLNVSGNASLISLGCNDNELSKLNVSNNTSLISLGCNDNELSKLDVSKNTSLVDLTCSGNNLVVLNVKNGNNIDFERFNALSNPDLTCIQVDDVTIVSGNTLWRKEETATYNEVCDFPEEVVYIPDANFKECLLANTAINTNNDGEIQVSEALAFTGEISCNNRDISDATGLEAFVNVWSINMSGNNLTNLSVSAHKNLQYLYCDSNSIEHLFLGNNLDLEGLFCDFNRLTHLDLSKNVKLNTIFCQNNELESLNIKNGNNDYNSDGYHFTGNPNLTCIQVDDKVGADNAEFWFKDATATYSEDCGVSSSDIVFIPDPNFKRRLLSNATINTNGDDEIQVTEATSFVGTIRVGFDGAGEKIEDLTGIEAFVNITGLHCSFNNLKTINVSENTKLIDLFCGLNELTSLDVSKNVNLENLYCSTNSLTELNVTNNTKLKTLYFDSNQITEIDLSNAIMLSTLSCYSNKLSVLDISKNSNLIDVTCAENQIKVLDLSSNQKLSALYCNDNLIEELDLSSTTIQNFDCSNNNLTSLIIDSGYSVNLDNFSLLNNPNLTCIQVDNKIYFDQNWTVAKDDTATYSENCTSTAGVVDEEFNNNIIVYPNPAIHTITIDFKETIQSAEFEIYSILGNTILKTNNRKIDISGLPEGMYILKIITADNKVGVRRFVKK